LKTKLILIVFSLVIGFNDACTQPLSLNTKLYYSCKVWGFVKYYHSRVSTCQIDWDSALVRTLPLIESAITKNDFNNAIDTLLNIAGPMSTASAILPDTISPALKRNRDFSWINDSIFNNNIRALLDTIKSNFRPHSSCWVQNNNYSSSYQGWLVFPHDSLILNNNTYSNYPDQIHRSLLLFKYWNVIRYFNPYNYVQNIPWDSTLYRNIIPLINAPSDSIFYCSFKKVTASLNDAHTEGLTYSTNLPFPKYYSPKLVLRYVQNKYVVVKSGHIYIHEGDAIESIDGMSTTAWEDSLRPYISAGNTSVFHRFMCQYILNGPFNSPIKIVYTDSTGAMQSINWSRDFSYEDPWFTSYYPNDSLATVKWKKFNCNVGYVNMGNLQQSDVNIMYATLKNCPSIIFDLRNYPNGTAWNIANLMYSGPKRFAKISIPDTSYPGTFFWIYDSLGINGNGSPYTGKIIVLVDQETQSQAEFSCMMLEAMPNVIKIGSQTAGTDGNVTTFKPSLDIQTGFTTLGIYYPNGDSTERIGIVPDSTVYRTQIGIRHKRDELLEKALQVSDCIMSVQNIVPEESVLVYPNPSTGKFSFSMSQINSLEDGAAQIFDIYGRIVYRTKLIQASNSNNLTGEIDISLFSSGVYLMMLQYGTRSSSIKLIKQ
jgi:carboxyl-terminal processing protease